MKISEVVFIAICVYIGIGVARLIMVAVFGAMFELRK